MEQERFESSLRLATDIILMVLAKTKQIICAIYDFFKLIDKGNSQCYNHNIRYVIVLLLVFPYVEFV